MKHEGKAAAAAREKIVTTLLLLVVVLAVSWLAAKLGRFIGSISGTLVALWVLFAAFVLYFFRDPDLIIPADPKAILSPAHGTVDVIDETTEADFLGGRCRRVSIFLSVFDVHVQRSPVAGKVAFQRHTPGLFLNAMKTESATHNENLLLGFDSTEKPGEKIAIRLIAGLIARRIVPWVNPGDAVARGERVSLIQFGSRVDVYLPLDVEVRVALGDKVRGGDTVIATRS